MFGLRQDKQERIPWCHGGVIGAKTGALEQTTLRLCEDLYHVYKNVENNSEQWGDWAALKLMIWSFYLLFSQLSREQSGEKLELHLSTTI